MEGEGRPAGGNGRSGSCRQKRTGKAREGKRGRETIEQTAQTRCATGGRVGPEVGGATVRNSRRRVHARAPALRGPSSEEPPATPTAAAQQVFLCPFNTSTLQPAASASPSAARARARARDPPLPHAPNGPNSSRNPPALAPPPAATAWLPTYRAQRRGRRTRRQQRVRGGQWHR